MELRKKKVKVQNPSARSGHRSVIVGSQVIIYGGYHSHMNRVFSEMWFYNFNLGEWNRIVQPPGIVKTPLSSSIVSVDGKIYLFGGTGYPFAYFRSSSVCSFDLSNHKWLEYKTNDDIFEEESATYGQSMVEYKKKLYIFGGTYGNEETNILRVFDTIKETWVAKNMKMNGYKPPQIYGHGAVIYGRRFEKFHCDSNRMFIIGGTTSDSVILPSLNSLFCYDIEKNIWSKEDTSSNEHRNNQKIFPDPRTNFACVRIKHYVFILGGIGEFNRVFDDIWYLSLRTFKWSKFHKKLNTPIYFHSASTDNYSIYVFGGVERDLSTRSNVLQVIDVYPKPLKSLCVGTIFQKITKENSKERREIMEKIPINIVKNDLRIK